MRRSSGRNWWWNNVVSGYPLPVFEKVKNGLVWVEVPRLYCHDDGSSSSPDVYQEMRKAERADEGQRLKGVLYGLSMRDYGEVIDAFEGGFGLSKTSVSREFY